MKPKNIITNRVAAADLVGRVVTSLSFIYPILCFRGRAVPTFRKDIVLVNEVPGQRREFDLHNLRNIIQGMFDVRMDLKVIHTFTLSFYNPKPN